MGLTARQQAFIDAYAGNATDAARKAGYSERTAKQQGARLLTNVDVARAIHARQERAARPLIATREERQRFWTDVMQSPEYEPRDRLKASELLGRSEADFTERVEHSGALTLEQLVTGTGPTE